VVADTPQWLNDAVAAFGRECRAKLAVPGVGDREAQIRAPLEGLLRACGAALSVAAVFHDEVRDSERRVRPDYGVRVNGAMSGYIEVKAPERKVNPATFTGHDKEQWNRLKDLPNLLYTNGTEWRLFRHGRHIDHTAKTNEPVAFTGSLIAGDEVNLVAPAAFITLMQDFLGWAPAAITSVGALVRTIAPLTRVLRGEVLDQVAEEKAAIAGGQDERLQPFLGLAKDWRALLFPSASDETFADGYAQTVTFGLLLARTADINLQGQGLHEVGARLGAEHSLIGRALQLLTDDVARAFQVTLDLLVRVVGAVDWSRVRKGRRDTYLYLYEEFLEVYDSDLRKQSGSYYTPREVVTEMVRIVEDVLHNELGISAGFRDPRVLTVDPAMGTGTYLHTILERAAAQTEAEDGPGAVPGVLAQVAARLVGFEIQMGPYAVAELRTSDLLATHRASPPPEGMRLYVTDTLDDPHANETQIGSGLQLIAASRRAANQVKAAENVTVVIGNPPYREHADGMGGWVEKGSGSGGPGSAPILDDWRDDGSAHHFQKAKNLYVYFWRWATWKVWESTIDDALGDAGVVCFVTTSGYLSGPAFTGMRKYLRKQSSEGWIIDLTPEGQTPDVASRIFPGVRQPLAIAIFIRKPGTTKSEPARVRYRTVTGRRADKFALLRDVTIDGPGWRETRTEWSAPFTPAATGEWDTFPAVGDIFPWSSRGVTAARRWVCAPSPEILRDRWRMLNAEPDDVKRRALFKETRDRTLTKTVQMLPGFETATPLVSMNARNQSIVEPIRIGYRAFDQQWIIPDHRVIDMARTDLWRSRIPGQVFVIEQHSRPISSGPGIVFSSLIVDQDYFNGRGGRVLPLLHPDGTANLAPGLVDALNETLGAPVTPLDVLAYVAGVTAHPAYTETFADALTTPGVRVPFTADPALWTQAVELGRTILWLHTSGDRVASAAESLANVRLPADDPRRVLALAPIVDLPTTMLYEAHTKLLTIGSGQIGPVTFGAWSYSVGDKNVLRSWFNYRKSMPGGRSTSPLDQRHVSAWDANWTRELLDLLSVLTRLTDLEAPQAQLLGQILASPLLSREQLRQAEVHWPQRPADRKTRRAPVDMPGIHVFDLE
jgi:hypothetical protein